MSILELVIAPDARLSICSEEVTAIDENIQKLANDMLETMYYSNGIGLAAVQVGHHLRMLVIDIPEDLKWPLDQELALPDQQVSTKEEEYRSYKSYGGPYCVINPKITAYSENKVSIREGCLSVPEQFGPVTRPEAITVEYLDKEGQKQIIKCNKWLARCFQHEIDHLNGILYIEHLSKLKYDMAVKKAAQVKNNLKGSA